MKYVFSDNGGYGKVGEIPRIWVSEQDKLPPFEYLYSISLGSCYREKLARTMLKLVWQVDEGVIIIALQQIKSIWTRTGLKANLEMAEKLIDWIINYNPQTQWNEEFFPSKACSKVSTSQAVKNVAEQVSEEVKNMIEQVITWKHTISRFKDYLPRQGYQSKISSNKYLLPISYVRFDSHGSDSTMLAGLKEMLSELKVDLVEPHWVNTYNVEWNIPERNMIITLPHGLSSKEVAGFLGYREEYYRYYKEQLKRATLRRSADKEKKIRNQEKLAALKQELQQKLLC
ncbi:hypothetical protein KAJ89_02875 [Candidatus Parcubacteria bacterium]|nr:hypothetical protein [Candidatus Parcubacteria bacterium]